MLNQYIVGIIFKLNLVLKRIFYERYDIAFYLSHRSSSYSSIDLVSEQYPYCTFIILLVYSNCTKTTVILLIFFTVRVTVLFPFYFFEVKFLKNYSREFYNEYLF